MNNNKDRLTAGQGEYFPVPEVDRIRYAGQMERVKLRIDEADELLTAYADERGLLYSAVQLRLAIEEIAFATLVGNRFALEEGQRQAKFKKWDQVCKSLKSLNPDYWPRGVRVICDEEGNTEWVDEDGTLSEAEGPKVWGRLSQLLHAGSPWDTPVPFDEENTFQRKLIKQLRLTLNEHIVKLVGSDALICCQVWSVPVRVYGFTAVGSAHSSDL